MATSTPLAAARPTPRPNATADSRSALMPTMRTASRFMMMARSARPSCVRYRNTVSAAMIASAMASASSRTVGISTGPNFRKTGSIS
ncbi:hypothetical protein D3C87_1874760 [compost metagenome]